MAYVFETLPADRSRIEIEDPLEVRYWAGKFGCSEAQLREVVAEVGTSAARVEQVIDGWETPVEL